MMMLNNRKIQNSQHKGKERGERKRMYQNCRIGSIVRSNKKRTKFERSDSSLMNNVQLFPLLRSNYQTHNRVHQNLVRSSASSNLSNSWLMASKNDVIPHTHTYTNINETDAKREFTQIFFPFGWVRFAYTQTQEGYLL